MVFYFSGTGNSRYVAHALAQNEQVINMADALKSGDCFFEPAPDEHVGFVLPVYYYGVPETVRTFLSRLGLKGMHHHYVYLVLTCGGSTGAADEQFQKLLFNRGYSLSAWYALAMPDNFFPMYTKADPAESGRQLRACQPHLQAIRAMIDRRVIGNHNPLRGVLPRLATALMYPFYRFTRKTGKFSASDKCISCGKCQHICPEEIITLEKGRPVWKKPVCTHCFACLHRCPVHAISYGRLTRRGSQYVHPDLESDRVY